MSPTYIRNFQVRHYECDPYGHVNNVNYLRYMEEAAFDASAAAGYSVARFNEMNRHWLARETNIEYLCALRHGDTFQVKTWIADFRRVACRRMYEFYCQTRLMATAHTDWVYTDAGSGKPVAISPELSATFLPDGPPEPRPVYEKFPDPPDPPEGIFTMPCRVTWQALDSSRHVNNATYVSYLDDCAMQICLAYDWPLERIAADNFAIVARSQRIQYRHPALFGDELKISTWISNVRRATAIRHFVVHRVTDGTLILRARCLYVWVNAQTGRPIRIPPHFLADFAPNIVG